MISKRSGSPETLKLTKRTLRLESLENREMLNGLGVLDAPEGIDTYQAPESGVQAATFGIGVMSVSGLSVTSEATTANSVTLKVEGDANTKVEISYVIDVTGKSKAFKTITLDGDGAGTIVVTGLEASTDYTFKAKQVGDSTVETATATTKALDAKVSGITSDGAKITWTKPSWASNFKVSYKIGSGEATEVETKAPNVTLTGLEAGKTYTFTVTDADDNPITTGTFETKAVTNAQYATVPPPTTVKAVYTAKTDDVKVTWKAPTNYTGDYSVVYKTGSTTKAVYVAAGDKLQVVLDGLTADSKYEVYVVAGKFNASDSSNTKNAIKSSSTFVLTGTPAVTVAAPTIGAAAKADVPGGVELTVTVPDGLKGVYVGIYTGTTTPKAGTAGLTFVSASGKVNFANVATKSKYVAYAVDANGNLSDAVTGDLAGSITDAGDWKKVASTGIDGQVKAIVDSETVSTVKLTWIEATVVPEGQTLKGFFVYVSGDGGKTWQYVAKAAAEAETVNVTGLTKTNVRYQFRLVAEFEDGDEVLSLGTAASVSLSAPNIAKLTPPITESAAAKITKNTGTDATITWKASTHKSVTGYRYTVYDANKTAIMTGTTTSAVTFDITAKLLTPGMKYTVEIVGLTADPLVTTTALNYSFTATAFAEAAAKASGITIAGATITITDKTYVSGEKFFYVEYTDIADAKGNADWNAAKIEAVTMSGVSGGVVTHTLTGLTPSTQYFVRIVSVDKAVTVASGKTAWDTVTKSAFGKDVKFKTAAPPLATVSKSGFAMDSTDFGFKFSIKSPSDNDTKSLLPAGTTFKYTLYVSAGSAVDKDTGLLLNSKSMGEVTFTSNVSKVIKFSDLGASGVLSALGVSSLEDIKALSFQLNVEYVLSSATYATVATKVAKINMPTWFKA